MARLPSAEKLRDSDKLPTYQDYLVNLVSKLNSINKLAYENLVASKERSKGYYDRTVNEKTFKVVSHVYLLKGSKPRKFGNHFTGPHEVLEVLDRNNIKIQFDKSHKIVHANRLRYSHVTSSQKKKNINKDESSDTDN